MDVKMISNDLRSSCRALLIGAYQDGGGGVGSGEWIYPESWLPLPEPDHMGINMIITSQNPILTYPVIEFQFHCDSPDSNITVKTEIDWGDGNVETISVPTNGYSDKLNHVYTLGTGHMAGDFEQFLIKIRCFDYKEAQPRLHTINYGKIQAIKIGNDMKFGKNGTTSLLCGKDFLKYIKSPSLDILEGGSFYELERFEYTGSPLTEIGEGNFMNCYSLTEENIVGIDFSKITSIGDTSFVQCYALHGLNAPNCTYVGSSAFAQCNSLCSVKLAENCTFGEGVFNYCYSLYDNPAYPKTKS